MRVLVVEARPNGRTPLRATEELRAIQNAVAHTSRKLEIHFCPAASLESLQRDLITFSPSVLHFIGHSDRDAVYLQDEKSNASQIVTPSALETALALTGTVQCVVLNSCFSFAFASQIAPRLGATFIGATHKIKDDLAIAFAASFYSALGGGADFATAYSAANNVAGARGAHEAFGYVGPAPRGRRLAGQDDWADAPELGPLVGRDAETRRLVRWIRDESARLIAICGLRGAGKTHLVTSLRPGGGRAGGQGKTSLSLAVAEMAAAGYDRITWRRLLNAPTIHELVQQIVGRDGTMIPESASQEMLTEALLDYLRRRRTLLILDNFESVLLETRPEAADKIPAVDPFVELVLAAALGRHDSCILITSRVVPAEIAKRHGPNRPVRLFEVGGIEPEFTRELVDADNILIGTEHDWTELNLAYSGNPLALDLAARHVRDIYGGEIRRFLDQGRLDFTDVATLIGWHIDRLSERERELATWLAINRAPSPLETLQEDVAGHESKRLVPSTLQALGRKLPLEASSQGFSLQPVLIESLTQRHAERAATELIEGRPGVHLHTVPLLKAIANEPVRQAHQRFVLDEVVASLADDPVGRTPLQILSAIVQTNEWPRQTYALGSIVNLVLRSLGGQLGDLGPIAGPIRQADFTVGDVRNTDLSAATFTDCSFNGAFGGTLALAFDDADRVWASGTDGCVRAWSTKTGALEYEYQVSDKWVRALSFSHDGALMVTAGDDTQVRLAPPGQADDAMVLTDHTDWVLAAQFGRGGHLVTMGEETLRLWDLAADEPRLLVLAPHERRMRDVAVDQSGDYLVSVANDRRALVIGIPSGTVEHTHTHTTELRRVALLPGEDKFVTGGQDGRLRQWQKGAPRPNWAADHHHARVSALAISRDGKVGISGCADGYVQVWDPHTGALLRTLAQHDGVVQAIDTSSDSRLAVTGGEDQIVRTWDLETGSLERSFTGYSNAVWSVNHWPSVGLVSSHEDGTVRLWSSELQQPSVLSAGRPALRYATKRARTTAWHPSSSSLFIGGDEGSVLRVGNATSRWEGHSGRITQIEVIDETRIVSASGDGTLRVWDVTANETVHLLTCDRSGQNSLSVAPSSHTVWTGGDDAVLRAFNFDDGELKASLSIGARIWSVAVSDDEARVAVATSSGVVHVVDTQRAQVVAELHGHAGWIWCARWIDDDHLVTSGEDGRIISWHVADGAGHIEWSVQASHDRVRTITIVGPDMVAAGSDDGGIGIWQVGNPHVQSTLRPPRPYEGVRINAACGLSTARIASLTALGAVISPT